METHNTSPSLLIIDDEPLDRAAVVRLLGSRYRIRGASTAAEGLAEYDREPASCVMLDYRLPDAEGLNTLDALVKRNAVVVVLTGIDSKDFGIQALKRGAQDYCVKAALSRQAAERVVAYAIERHRLIASTRAALRALRESEQRFNDIASRISEGLWVRTADGTQCLYLSPTFEQIWGRTLVQMNQASWSSTIHPDDRVEARLTFLRARESGSEYRSSYRIQRPDGTTRFIENHGFPVHNEHGCLVRLAGIARDITDHRQLQEDLRLAQRLESVGQLAAGIAHEINTPSQYVSDNIAFLGGAMREVEPLLSSYRELLDVAKSKGASDAELARFEQLADAVDLDYLTEEIPSALQQSADGIQHIKQIVLAMNSFSHPGQTKEFVDLNAAIESTLTVARHEWHHLATVELALDRDLPQVPCIPASINQVLLNLIVNAAHAIGDVVDEGEKGVIRIATRVEDGKAVFVVEDTGCGIPMAIRERIFDPFFTTKDVGQGTGQGLAIAYAVVKERHGGVIGVDSTPGKGTRFTVGLPLQCADDAEAAA